MEGMIICNPRIQFQRPLNVAQCPIQILAVLEEIRVPIMDEVMVRIYPESLLISLVRLDVFLTDPKRTP